MTWRRWKLAVSVMAFHALGVCLFWIWSLSRPHMVEPIEIRMANLIMLWREGYLPYGFANHLPAVWNPYGFMYEWLCSLKWGMLHPYWNGRMVSLIAMVSVAISLVVWSQRQAGSVMIGATATLLLLTAKPMVIFAHLCRVDTLGVALSLTGFIFTIGCKNRLLFTAGIFMMILAFHTKLTFIAAPLACCLSYILQKNWRNAVVVGTTWSVGALGGLAILQWLTDGAYLFQAKIGNEPSAWTKPIDMLLRPLASSPFWMLALFFWARSRSRHLTTPEFVYSLCSLMIAITTATNPGSSWNYLMEFYAALSLLTVKIIKESSIARLSILFLIHSLFSLFQTGHQITKDIQRIVAYSRTYEHTRSRMADVLSRHSRIIVLESSVGMDALLSFGKANYLDLPHQLTSNSRQMIREAIREGSLDKALVGDELNEMEVVIRKKM